MSTHFALGAMRGSAGAARGLSAGVNLPMNLETSLLFVGAAMTAPDGRCKALDASADGYVRSEACVAICLRCASAQLRQVQHLRLMVHQLASHTIQQGQKMHCRASLKAASPKK